jgi:hypothetical protein
MRYAYRDLGEQPSGTEITVRLAGSAANVLLLDPSNYSSYRAARPFRYTGGLHHRSPARLTVPRDGHWYLVIDLGGHRGRVRANVESINPPGGEDADGATTRKDDALEAVS